MANAVPSFESFIGKAFQDSKRFKIEPKFKVENSKHPFINGPRVCD